MAAGYDLKNEEEVKEYVENLGIEYRFSCYHEKMPSGCHLLGDYLEAIKRDFINAARVYKLNCDNHDFGRSCHKYGSFRYVGKGIDKNPGEALKYFIRGCEKDCAEACLLSGAILSSGDSVPADVARSQKFLEKGCQAGNAEACFYLSGTHITGAPSDVNKNMNLAFKYAESACHLGHMQACANLSQMYKRGEGTEANQELSQKYRQLATDIRDEHVKQSNTIKFG